jgi:hypothetical protein
MGKETKFATDKVDPYLKRVPGLWFLNVHGSGMQRPGVPDRLVCYRGRMVVFELKRPDGEGEVSERQEIEMTKLEMAGAVVRRKVETLEEIIETIEAIKNGTI